MDQPDKEQYYTFSEALVLLKEGQPMKIPDWQEEYIALSMPKSSHFVRVTKELCTKVTIDKPYILWSDGRGHYSPGWVPGQYEMLEADWMKVNV